MRYHVKNFYTFCLIWSPLCRWLDWGSFNDNDSPMISGIKIVGLKLWLSAPKPISLPWVYVYGWLLHKVWKETHKYMGSLEERARIRLLPGNYSKSSLLSSNRQLLFCKNANILLGMFLLETSLCSHRAPFSLTDSEQPSLSYLNSSPLLLPMKAPPSSPFTYNLWSYIHCSFFETETISALFTTVLLTA